MVHIAQLENIVYTGNWWGGSLLTPLVFLLFDSEFYRWDNLQIKM